MTDPIRISFAREVLELRLDAILPVRPMTVRIVESKRYVRIATSVRQIGIVEPLAVTVADRKGRHMLVDGHLRLHALREASVESARCIVADDDEAFTYNKRVNRLATVQEHYMITRALDRGVPAAMIAAALGMDETLVARRRTMLDRISSDTVEILKDKHVNAVVFDILRKLKPEKQFAAAEMMAAMNNFTASYARAILAATRQCDLAKPDQPKKILGVTPEQMARMERELETLNADFRARDSNFGDDVLELVLSSRYLKRLIGNDKVASYITSRYPEIMNQFRSIVDATSLDAN